MQVYGSFAVDVGRIKYVHVEGPGRVVVGFHDGTMVEVDAISGQALLDNFKSCEDPKVPVSKK
jgi:hypothetical protein